MSIHKRKNRDGSTSETFTADFQYLGKRISEDTGCRSRTEAKRWVEKKKREMEAEQSRSADAASSDLTLSQALAKYWTEKLHKSASAGHNEKYVVQTLEACLGSNSLLRNLSTADVAKYIRDRLDQDKVAESTVVRELNVLRAVHGWAMQVWEIPVRPIGWKKIWPKVPERLRDVPTAEEVRRLMDAASPRLAEVILFAAMTGLRKDEIKRLKGKNVRLDLRSLRFIGKGNKEALIPLNSVAMSVLSSKPLADSWKVFDMTNFRREWDAAREYTNLSHIEFHGLRHACATWLRDLGVKAETIQLALRHSDIATTLIYAHAGNSELSNALEQLASKLQPKLLGSSPSTSSESETGSEQNSSGKATGTF